MGLLDTIFDIMNPWSDLHKIQPKKRSDAELVAAYETPYKDGVSFAAGSMADKSANSGADFLMFWDKTTTVRDGEFIRNYPDMVAINTLNKTIDESAANAAIATGDFAVNKLLPVALVVGGALLLFEFGKGKVKGAAA